MNSDFIKLLTCLIRMNILVQGLVYQEKYGQISDLSFCSYIHFDMVIRRILGFSSGLFYLLIIHCYDGVKFYYLVCKFHQ